MGTTEIEIDRKQMEFQDKCLEIEFLDDLIFVLQGHREHYGNVPVHIDLSAGKMNDSLPSIQEVM